MSLVLRKAEERDLQFLAQMNKHLINDEGSPNPMNMAQLEARMRGLMNMKPIGEISQINRYPVKSFAGERLNSVELQSYGLLGDRSHAFVDPTKEGWNRYVTARQIPEMLKYSADLESQTLDLEFPQVKITGPNGRIHTWDEQLHKEIQTLSDHVISTERHSLKSQEQLAVDDGSILIITDRSLKRIEQLWGKQLDHRRFRANLLLTLYDDANDHEPDYIGKHLTIGNVELSIRSLCQRCSMITIDPDHLQRDSTLLKNINENLNLCFGMYADVVKVGMVQVGDHVYIRNVSELWDGN